MKKTISNQYLHVLLIVIVIDITTGFVKAIVKGEADSSVGIKGLLKHTLVAITTILITFCLPIFNLGYINNSLITFFILQYLVSIMENWVQLNLPIPKVLYKMIKEKSDKIELRISTNQEPKADGKKKEVKRN